MNMASMIQASTSFVFKYQAMVTLFAYMRSLKLALHLEEAQCQEIVIQLT